MKTFLRRVLISWFISTTVLALLVVGIRYFPEVWSPPLIRFLESKGSKAILGELRIGNIEVTELWPMTLSIKKLSAEAALKVLVAEIEEIRISARFEKATSNKGYLKINHHILLDQPKVAIFYASSAGGQVTAGAASPSGRGSPIVLPMDQSLDLEIKKGVFEVKTLNSPVTASLSDIELTASVPSFVDKPVHPTVDLKTLLKLNLLPVGLPLALKVEKASVSSDSVSVETGQFVIAGIGTIFKGWTNFESDASNWQVDVEKLSVDQLPIPSGLLPIKWSGAIRGRAIYDKKPGEKIAKLTCDLQSKGLQAEVAYQTGSFVAAGHVPVEILAQLSYSDKLEIKSLVSNWDMTNLDIQAEGVFRKPKSVPLISSTEVYYDQKDFTHKSRLRLANVIIDSSGGFKQTRTLIHPAPLRGMEKFFPALADFPMQGVIEVEVETNGPINDTENLKINLKKLALRGLQMSLALEKGKTKISGPIRVDLDGSATATGKIPESAHLTWSAELSQAEIENETIKKAKGQTLRGGGSLRYRPDQVHFDPHVLIFPENGQLTFAGEFRNFANPRLDMTFNLRKLNLAGMTRMLRKPPIELAGQLNGGIAIRGEYKSRLGLEHSPLELVAKVNGSRLEILFPKAQAKPSATAAGSEGAAAGFTVPRWMILKQAALDLDVDVARFRHGELEFADAKSHFSMRKGVLTGVATIAKIWSGSMGISKFKVPITDSNPNITTNFNAKNLMLQDLLSYLSPPMKEFGNGLLSFQGWASLPIPGTLGWIDSLQSAGTVTVEKGLLKTMPISKMIGEKLAQHKITGVKPKASNVDFAARSKYGLARSKLTLTDFVMETADKDRLDLNGKIGFDLNADLHGTAYLASVPVGGSIRAANSDSTGRLILPLAFTGNLLQPKVDIAQSTIEALLARTASYEANKLKQKAKAQVDQELSKQKQKFEDSMKKKLKNILGR